MVRASELIQKISEFTGIEEVTIARYARFAREAGFLSQAGRGNSAAQMQPTDAIHLLACVLMSGTAQEAGSHIKKFKQITVDYQSADHIDDRHLNKEQKKGLQKVLPILYDREHSLYDLLSELLKLAMQDPKTFKTRFDESDISFSCDEFGADIDFNIDVNDSVTSASFQRLTSEKSGQIRRVNVSFSYNYPLARATPEGFRRSSYLSFSVIAQIAEVISTKSLH